MAETLIRIGENLPFIAVGATVLGGVAALVLAAREPIAQRQDRRVAVRIAILYGVVIWGITTIGFTLFGMGWGGDLDQALPAALLFGLPVGLVVGGASLAGYVLLTRIGRRSSPVLGALAGPLVLGAVCALAVWLITAGKDLRVQEQRDTHVAAVAVRSEGLHVSASDATATTKGNGVVDLVSMHVVVRADTRFRMDSIPEKVQFPVFRLVWRPEGDQGSRIEVQAPSGSPTVYEPGTETGYDLTFSTNVTGVTIPTGSGEWLLQLWFTGTDGQEYGAETPVEVEVS